MNVIWPSETGFHAPLNTTSRMESAARCFRPFVLTLAINDKLFGILASVGGGGNESREYDFCVRGHFLSLVSFSAGWNGARLSENVTWIRGVGKGWGCIGVLPTFPVRGETGNDAEIFR